MQHMWMPRSDGLYSPSDSPEPSLLDLYGSSTSASNRVASIVEGIARAQMDDDSVETDLASVHVD
jgi:hypothetical protein